jgi:hypothetical protein
MMIAFLAALISALGLSAPPARPPVAVTHVAQNAGGSSPSDSSGQGPQKQHPRRSKTTSTSDGGSAAIPSNDPGATSTTGAKGTNPMGVDENAGETATKATKKRGKTGQDGGVDSGAAP